MRPNGSIRFLGQFLRRPGAVGAIAPSSRHLARRMVEWVDWSRVETAVEYGPGTGAVTQEILARLPARATFIAFESNPAMADLWQGRFPGQDLHFGSATTVGRELNRRGRGHTDVVISGLPWASFPETLQREILAATVASLRPGGQFATFAYLQGLLLPGGIRFRRLLREYFDDIETSSVTWLNLPPAIVYRCRGRRELPE
ncbi:MAG: ribosomal RNA adenine dimethylase domain-containing protein [Lentisphaeria bacterium]|nr:ribosomal RNA adenine dimethylase domain-containing protein [Lentisphaeria bacterium]